MKKPVFLTITKYKVIAWAKAWSVSAVYGACGSTFLEGGYLLSSLHAEKDCGMLHIACSYYGRRVIESCYMAVCGRETLASEKKKGIFFGG